MDKVNLDTIKPWITKRITEILGMEDEIVNGLIFEMLNNEKVSRVDFYQSQFILVYELNSYTNLQL